MARIVLTGANGLLGQEVVRLLAEAGDEAICIGRHPSGIEGRRVTFVEADLTRGLSAKALPERADAVVHLAQSERFNEFPEGADAVFAINVAAPAFLLDWARRAGVTAFVHASSGGLYGGGPKPFVETDPLIIGGRIAFYLSTKRATEQLAEPYQGLFAVAALRFFFIYGARQRPHMLMPRLAASVRDGHALTLQGERGMAINPIHARDAAHSVVAAVRRQATGVYNVAGPDVASIRDIGESLGRHLGRAPLFDVQRDVAPNNLVADIERMRKDLHVPKIALDDGLREMYG